jgi:hypothetical protein
MILNAAKPLPKVIEIIGNAFLITFFALTLYRHGSELALFPVAIMGICFAAITLYLKLANREDNFYTLATIACWFAVVLTN